MANMALKTAALSSLAVFVVALAFLKSTTRGEYDVLDSDGSTAVTGEPLSKCDRSSINDPQFPTTGWKRQDLCTAEASDQGSHFVCVNLPGDFWVKTGQAESQAEADASWPKPGPWCICMWAYANYLAKYPDFSADLICDATNYWVLTKYDVSKPSQCQALLSICQRCGLKDSICPLSC